MKASELMIGDWVMHNRTYPKEMHTPKQVLGIKKMPCAKMPGMYIMLEGVDTHEDNCSPIPLTEEMLQANFGDKQRHNCGEGYYFDTKDGVENCIVDGVLIIGRVAFDEYDLALPVTHVHQLQHALRLCGLNDLADNFKIE